MQDHDTALAVLTEHWNTWITEADFQAIAAAGFVVNLAFAVISYVDLLFAVSITFVYQSVTGHSKLVQESLTFKGNCPTCRMLLLGLGTLV